MHRSSEADIAAAYELLVWHDLRVAKLNSAPVTDPQLMDALRARESVRGWIYTAEHFGETRKALKELPSQLAGIEGAPKP